MKVYLDNNATTMVDSRVAEAMRSTFGEQFGNPASVSHAWGWQAEELVTIARENIASLVGADPRDIIFTSGATEAINLALLGLRQTQPKRIIHSTIEHKATLDVAAELSVLGFDAVEVGVNKEGLIDFDFLEQALKTPTAVTSIIAANNEIGTIQDLEKIVAISHAHKCLVHLDATQLVGKAEVDFKKLNVDMASFSGHKIYGPKGVGALYVNEAARDMLKPVLFGGGHERGLRSGTLNVPGIVGMGKACEILNDELPEVISHLRELTHFFHNALQAKIPGLSLNGSKEQRIPGNLNLQMPGCQAQDLISKLATSIALSSSSACLAMSGSGSHVLKAIGLNQKEIDESFRVGIGRFNTKEELAFAAKQIASLP